MFWRRTALLFLDSLPLKMELPWYFEMSGIASPMAQVTLQKLPLLQHYCENFRSQRNHSTFRCWLSTSLLYIMLEAVLIQTSWWHSVMISCQVMSRKLNTLYWTSWQDHWAFIYCLCTLWRKETPFWNTLLCLQVSKYSTVTSTSIWHVSILGVVHICDRIWCCEWVWKVVRIGHNAPLFWKACGWLRHSSLKTEASDSCSVRTISWHSCLK